MIRTVNINALAALLCLALSLPARGGAPVVRSLAEDRYQNLVRQQWELSCAAASLATVLRFQHGVPVTERSVALGLIGRKEYLENPDLVRLRQGFSLLDLKRFVSRIGFKGTGLGKLELSDLLDRAPAIVPVRLMGFPHFVVFRGATDHRVLLADPAFGNISVPIYKFMKGWIIYRDVGRVGFVVERPGSSAGPGGLSARASDFVMLE